jgi:cytochrome c oxidase cbb3-type subunit 4
MDIDVFRGVVTVVLMALFIALVIWTYSRTRTDEFARLERLPLEDDSAPPEAETSQKKKKPIA